MGQETPTLEMSVGVSLSLQQKSCLGGWSVPPGPLPGVRRGPQNQCGGRGLRQRLSDSRPVPPGLRFPISALFPQALIRLSWGRGNTSLAAPLFWCLPPSTTVRKVLLGHKSGPATFFLRTLRWLPIFQGMKMGLLGWPSRPLGIRPCSPTAVFSSAHPGSSPLDLPSYLISRPQLGSAPLPSSVHRLPLLQDSA